MSKYYVDPMANRNDAPFINAREAFRPQNKPIVKSKIDVEVSKIVGKSVNVNDPKLIQQVKKWKQYNQDADSFDNHLKDPKKREELKKIFQ